MNEQSAAFDVDLCIATRPTYWYCEPGWEWKSPPLNDFLLWYILDGVGVMRLNQHEWPLQAGSCFVFAPGEQPHGTQDPNQRLVVFGMHFDILDEQGVVLQQPPALIPPHGHVVRDSSFFTLLAQHCHASWNYGDAFGALQSRTYLQTMLLYVCEEVRRGPPSLVDTALQAIMRAIQIEPGRRWSVEDLAQQAHLSRAQFERRFRTVAGYAPTQFIIQVRLERARHLIQETNMTLNAIANVLGYDDVSFFSRQFKHAMGYAPSALRRGEGVKIEERRQRMEH